MPAARHPAAHQAAEPASSGGVSSNSSPLLLSVSVPVLRRDSHFSLHCYVLLWRLPKGTQVGTARPAGATLCVAGAPGCFCWLPWALPRSRAQPQHARPRCGQTDPACAPQGSAIPHVRPPRGQSRDASLSKAQRQGRHRAGLCSLRVPVLSLPAAHTLLPFISWQLRGALPHNACASVARGAR